jgi:hypothetical protein
MVEMRGDNVRQFLNDWEMTLEGLKKQPEEEWLEYCFNNNLTKPAIFQPKQTIGQLGMRI